MQQHNNVFLFVLFPTFLLPNICGLQFLKINTTETMQIDTSSGRVQFLESGDLLISNVRESDAGLYTCTRSNEAGTVFGEAYLGVMGKFLANLPFILCSSCVWFDLTDEILKF